MLELKKGSLLADRYTLDRQLGGGGEAETWLARDQLTGAGVALKIVRGGAAAAARLRQEWQTNLRLLHAHIVRAFEFHEDDDAAFYSLQYVDGPDISALSGSSLENILAPAGLIADALRYAHAKGIVHRDIKASNILLDRNGAPYLSDFGVAAAVGSVGEGGSLAAQSPQSLAGEAAQPADDIFALGGLIYELVAGRSPYSSAETKADIESRVPDTLLAADGSGVPEPVRELVAAMLDKDATRRPDAETVTAELRAAGFAPGPATVEHSAAPRIADEEIESVRAIRQRRPAATAAPVQGAQSTGQGISAKTMGIALGVLLLVLLGVVFLLPRSVTVVPEDEALVTEESEARSRDTRDAADDDDGFSDERRVTRDYEPENKSLGDEKILFNENDADYTGLDDEGKLRVKVEMILGELLSDLETLNKRSVQRWAPLAYRKAQESYAAGDAAYLEKNYRAAEEHYLDALTVLEPLFDRIEPEFQKAYSGAVAAFDAGDRAEALRLFELAVAITPNSPEARAGYERAQNLDKVLQLVDQGLEFEEELELDAAEASFQRAIALDPEWVPAQEGLARVRETRTKIEFDTRMTEGLEALVAGNYLEARAAFRMAQKLIPGSSEPADGLLQVDQGLRLQTIETLAEEARVLEASEDWDAAVTTYESILEIDGALEFAITGLAEARRMSALHSQLDEYISEPDQLANPAIMQKVTMLVVDITRMPDIGPRLAAQRDELSRLLKRAATPLTVELRSDNMTTVTVYKVGNLGSFTSKELSLRPGTYVAVGVRPGYRDVRREFRVAPEVDMQPVVVRCEEAI